MNISLTGYLTGFTYQNLGKALPYLLVLWGLVNVSARFIVKRQRQLTLQAAGRE